MVSLLLYATQIILIHHASSTLVIILITTLVDSEFFELISDALHIILILVPEQIHLNLSDLCFRHVCAVNFDEFFIPPSIRPRRQFAWRQYKLWTRLLFRRFIQSPLIAYLNRSDLLLGVLAHHIKNLHWRRRTTTHLATLDTTCSKLLRSGRLKKTYSVLTFEIMILGNDPLSSSLSHCTSAWITRCLYTRTCSCLSTHWILLL